MNAKIARGDRHALNVTLHRAGLPTLGKAHTLGDYLSALPKAKRSAARSALGLDTAPAKPKASGSKWTCACTSVREHIVASKDGHAAQTAALFAQAG